MKISFEEMKSKVDFMEEIGWSILAHGLGALEDKKQDLLKQFDEIIRKYIVSYTYETELMYHLYKELLNNIDNNDAINKIIKEKMPDIKKAAKEKQEHFQSIQKQLLELDRLFHIMDEMLTLSDKPHKYVKSNENDTKSQQQAS